MNFSFYRFLLWVLVVGLFANNAAAMVHAGKWEVDQRIQQAFETGKLLPDHTYYYLGSYAAPTTVIALDNHYTLRENNVWAKVDEMSEKVLKGWLNVYRTEGSTYFDYSGGVILTPDGKRAGVWYSPNTVNIVEMPDPGVLVIFQPHTPSGATYGNQDGGSHSRW